MPNFTTPLAEKNGEKFHFALLQSGCSEGWRSTWSAKTEMERSFEGPPGAARWARSWVLSHSHHHPRKKHTRDIYLVSFLSPCVVQRRTSAPRQRHWSPKSSCMIETVSCSVVPTHTHHEIVHSAQILNTTTWLF